MRPDQALSDEIEHDVKRRFEAGTPYSSRDFEGMTDKEHGLVLHHTGMLQRGGPETAMERIRGKIGSGVYSHAVEHIGDIYHRAQENAHIWAYTRHMGHSLVMPKLTGGIRDLNHPYGFEREMRENLISNAKFSKDPSINWDTAVILGKDYAKEHSRLPVYNEPAHWTTQATQHLGNMRFGAASAALQNLAHYFEKPSDDVDPEKHWDKLTQAWATAHSRQSTIDFLKAQGK